MKKKKSLVVTYIKIFIVIAIIAVGIFFAIKFFSKEYNSAEYETIKTDMLLIQGKTEVFISKSRNKGKRCKIHWNKIKR